MVVVVLLSEWLRPVGAYLDWCTREAVVVDRLARDVYTVVDVRSHVTRELVGRGDVQVHLS